MRRMFREMPGACDATLEIAERCNLELEMDSTSTAKYPQFGAPDGSPREEILPADLSRRARAAIRRTRHHRSRGLRQRLDYEISVSKRGSTFRISSSSGTSSSGRRSRMPVGPGRGSAAGSLVAYSLEITDLDPIRFGLLFERFLNPERVSPPDIDVDFCQSRRGEVIDYVRQKVRRAVGVAHYDVRHARRKIGHP